MADCFTDDWYQYVIDYAASVHVGLGTEAVDVATLRAAAIDYIWKGAGIPATGADVVGADVDVSAIVPALSNLLRADKLTFNMNASLTAVGYVLYPITSASKLIIFGPGHSATATIPSYQQSIRLLLARGCTVFFTDMPGVGTNIDQGLTHAQIGALSDGSYCGLQAFLDPFFRALNELDNGYNLTGVFGFSGGGWMATFLAALDERVEVSVPTAGSFPRPLRLATGSPCTVSWDWEQGSDNSMAPTFFTNITYEDLYIMGCSSGRRSVQCINRLDGVLSYGTGWKKYAGSTSTIVIDRAAALSSGEFVIYQYEDSAGHVLNSEVKQVILSEFGLASSTPITNNLIAYYPLDEHSGLRADALGNNDLADNNTVLFATGKIGDCADFESTNSEWLSITDNPTISVGDIDFTFAGWVQMESKAAAMIAWGQRGTNSKLSHCLMYRNTVDRLQFNISNNGTTNVQLSADALGSPAIGTWYFVVYWHDSVANTINIQVNNGTVNSAAHTTGAFNSSAPFAIGCQFNITDQAADFWDGLVDELGFWKRVLTADERTWLYNSGVGRTYAEVLAGIPDPHWLTNITNITNIGG